MKTVLVKSTLYFLFSASYISALSQSTIPPSAIKGDFNGDKISEYAWITTPELSIDSMSCKGKCISYIQFSNKNINPIQVVGAVGGELTNVGDINGDGKDEIGLIPGWFTSCWRSFHVYTYKKGKWMNAVLPFPIHCNTVESEQKLIIRDPNKKGCVIIKYSEFATNGKIITKTKSIAVH